MQVKTNLLIHTLGVQSFSQVLASLLSMFVNPMFVHKDILRTWSNDIRKIQV